MEKKQVFFCSILFLFLLSSSISFGKTYSNISIEHQEEVRKEKIRLYWKQITPYIVIKKGCDSERTIFLYSELDGLTLNSNSTEIFPQEVVAVHEIKRKNISNHHYQMILRYTFCVDNTLKEVFIKNDLYESYPIDLDQENFYSIKNIGFALDSDKEYLVLKADAIEESESKRSLAIESMYSSKGTPIEKLDLSSQNSIAKSSESTELSSLSASEEEKEFVNQVETENPAIEQEKNTIKEDRQNIVIEEGITLSPKEFFIRTTENENFNLSNITLDGNGNGYKIQIIAKKRDNHNAESIKYYYGIPYTVEEHYDGIWHRFTLENYGSSWEETYRLLKTIRADYGISDAFISLYQNYERVGIYPCNEENLFKHSMEFAEYISDCE